MTNFKALRKAPSLKIFLGYSQTLIDEKSEVSNLNFLKWKYDVIAKINFDFSVDFIDEKSSLLTKPDGGNASVHQNYSIASKKAPKY